MEIIKEYICDLAPDKQREIRAEVEQAYKFFGYSGKQLERMIAKAMDSTLADVCNLMGAYKYILDNEKMAADVICGRSADSALQDDFI